MKGERLLVAAASDDGYAMPLAVMVESLLENCRPEHEVRLLILDGGVSPPNRRRLTESWPFDNLKVRWLRPDDAEVVGLRTIPHLTTASFYRLLLPELLPEEPRVLYLDCDLLVRRDLADLFNMDFGDAVALGVRDMGAPTVAHPLGVPEWRRLGFSQDALCFNSGVLLMDLERWRREGLARQVIDYLRRRGERVVMGDQEGINAVLGPRIREIDFRWNQQTELFLEPSPMDDFPAQEVLEEARRDPYIIHFSTPEKPWQPGNWHPWRGEWLSHLKRTAWAADGF